MLNVCILKSAISFLFTSGCILAAPPPHAKAWPPMKSYDIWSTSEVELNQIHSNSANSGDVEIYGDTNYRLINSTLSTGKQNKPYDNRRSKVLNFFPVSVDGECLSNDGRRSGLCLNVYECRMQGGSSRGECALGFGVCCVFVAGCDQEIKNNITYVVSPNFPNFMPRDLTSCRVKVRLINEDISQLRIDFNHFILGQPNRRTGVCDGDIFRLTGGLGGIFTLCGQNSGQHMYYDVGGGTSRSFLRQAELQNAAVNSASMVDQVQTNMSASAQLLPDNSPAAVGSDSIEILMNFTRSSLVSLRLWEIRVAQIPFSQRAPTGCLQYYTGVEGVIQTFNFADNGRHLANQDYRACIRQESNMCSITYEPCDSQSFRIGPNQLNDDRITEPADSSSTPPASTFQNNMSVASVGNSQTESFQTTPSASESSIATRASTPQPTSQSTLTEATSVQADEPDAVEGSGGGEVSSPAPVRGGFNIFTFFRNTFGFGNSSRNNRKGRQFTSTCTDRITIPCIVEDFIGSSLGPLPGCEPIHCGSNFCSSSSGSCRIESTVVPFRVGIHFGDGLGKGYAEENIGMCLRYSQIGCM